MRLMMMYLPFRILSLDSVEENYFGVSKTYDLKEDGRTIYANNFNKKEYVKDVCAFKMGKLIDEQTRAIQSGIYEIIPAEYFKIIDYKELGLFLVGDQDINEVSGDATKDSEIIQNFLKFMRESDQKTKSKFVFFCSGAFKLPIGGYKMFPLQIDVCGSENSLPVAHTCFNKIDLPKYPTYEILKDKLTLAMNEGGRGFYIL